MKQNTSNACLASLPKTIGRVRVEWVSKLLDYVKWSIKHACFTLQPKKPS